MEYVKETVDYSLIRPSMIDNQTDLRSTKTELFNKLTAASPCHRRLESNTQTNDSVPSLPLNSDTICGSNLCTQPTLPPAEKHYNEQICFKQQTEEIVSEQTLFSRFRNRWYTNDEVACILTNYAAHLEWQTEELVIRPKSGAVLIYSRDKVRYRQDGYCWKKRKNGRTTREDHMKLKVQGIECIYGCYVHSAILPTFHRRCYWLLQNPDVVLVHYLNQPPDNQNKMLIMFNSTLLEEETRRSWTHEEIIEEIGAVFGGISKIQPAGYLGFPSSNTLPGPITSDSIGDTKLYISLQPEQVTTGSNAIEISSPNNLQGLQTKQLNQVQHENLFDGVENGATGAACEAREFFEPTCMDKLDIVRVGFRWEEGRNLCGSGSTLKTCNTHDLIVDQSAQHQQEDHNLQDAFQQVSEDVICCFNYNNSPTNNVPMDAAKSNMNVMIDQVSNQNVLTNELLEQNLCSPVTQIYNEMVDDIVTYALPIEPDEYNSNLHHHGHDHDLSSHAMAAGSIEMLTSGPDKTKNQSCPQINQFGDSSRKQFEIDCGLNRNQSDLTPYPMDMNGSSNLFLNRRYCLPSDLEMSQNINGLHEDAEGSLVNSFQLQAANHVTCELENGVEDSLTNVDCDLRDLMML